MTSQPLYSVIKEALSSVIDPETGLNVMRMEIIQDIDVSEDGTVRVTFRPSSPICPMAFTLAESIRQSLLDVDGVRSVYVNVENFRDADRLERIVNRLNEPGKGNPDEISPEAS